MINIIAVFWIVVSMILIESITAYAVVNPLPSNESTGISYIVYECDTKQTLLKQNADLPADCSLLARLMTCLLVLENQSISVTDYISPSEDSISASGRYTLLASNQYMVDHLIKSVILCNADNAARALASHVNPNTEYFISIMNQKAKELGMNNTFFINPDGTADQLCHDKYTIPEYCSKFRSTYLGWHCSTERMQNGIKQSFSKRLFNGRIL